MLEIALHPCRYIAGVFVVIRKPRVGRGVQCTLRV